MKFLTPQVAAFLQKGSSRHNIRLLLRFVAILIGMISVYSVVFHLLMQREEQEHTWLTGFYWTITVMSTLGFGDITFHTDLGRAFSILVLLTGMIFLMILLPFTLIEFFYAPWVEAQARARAPRELPQSTRGHVILTHYDSVTTTLIRKLDQFGYPYCLLVRDPDTALRLHDEGIQVMVGEPDLPDTYEKIRLPQAALVAATGSDVENTNIAFTVRELSKGVPIVTTVSQEAAMDILQLAGSNRVFRLGQLMGQALARRISGGDAISHVIGHFDKLLIAEATATGTPLIGKTLTEANLRSLVGVSVIGVWERGVFHPASAGTRITGNTVLVICGLAEQLRNYDQMFCIYHVNQSPVVIIGGGRVGRATGRALEQRKVDFRIVEKLPERVRQFENQAVIGDASDLEILERAGIKEAPAVIVTPHDDDQNIYLTIYCRKLCPDIQIISRAVQERNVSTLHRAGADFVMSYASMGSNIIFNFLKRSDILMIAEGLNIFKVKLPPPLQGKSLAEGAIRPRTGCTVVALQRNGDMLLNPDPNVPMDHTSEIVLISNAESEKQWFDLFG